MRKAFTLIELLVVMAIMGLMGTAAVGGYRQMQRGMEERGVMQNVNKFISNAYQRARIDRQPTAVYFWNEMLRGATENENEIVVGRAVAVRRHGRITKVQGNKIFDEFGDLNLTYPGNGSSATEENADPEDPEMDADGQYSQMKLYQLTDPSKGLKYSYVRDKVQSQKVTEIYLTGDPTMDNLDPLGADKGGKGTMYLYAFQTEGGNAQWNVGDAYGMEFESIQLPHGYIFGSSAPTSMASPITQLDSLTIVFKPSGAAGSATVTVSSMRPTASGALSAQKVATSDKPQDEY